MKTLELTVEAKNESGVCVEVSCECDSPNCDSGCDSDNDRD